MAEELALKYLTFVRHGQAVPHCDFAGRDFDRPLTEAGAREVDLLNAELEKGLLTPPPDLLLVSGALRTVETARHLPYLSSAQPRILVLDELYECLAGQLYSVILEQQKGASVAAVIGHNPGLSQLYSMLTGTFTVLGTAQCRTLVLEDGK